MKPHQEQWLQASIRRLEDSIATWQADDRRDAWRMLIQAMENGYADTDREITPVEQKKIAETRDESKVFLIEDPKGDIPF